MSEEYGEDKPILNKNVHGRGTSLNPMNRFEEIEFAPDPEFDFSEEQNVKTKYYLDTTRTLISYNNSPDIPFDGGINPYRGCEHGCIYCYARPSHEYFGLSLGLDFETRIFVKPQAPELLRKEMSSAKWKPTVLALSGNTDCYQPIERTLGITRKILEILLEFRNPVGMVTKNKLITRDIDLLKELTKFDLVNVCVSVTTLDKDLARKMEPRASTPPDRLQTIEALAKAGILVGVLVAPIIPALTDHEMPLIIKECANRGATQAGFTILRLPYQIKDLFEDWLVKNFPERKEKILNRIKEIRGGKLNDPRFGARMRGEGIFAEQIKSLFIMACKKNAMNLKSRGLTTKHFQKPKGPQLTLFD